MRDPNLKVLIYDHDVFALHAINSYLAWDRRTRVHFLTYNVEAAFQWLAETTSSEWPDVILLDSYAYTEPAALTTLIKRFLNMRRTFDVMVLAHKPDIDLCIAAYQAGAKAFLIRNDIHIYMASAVIWAVDQRFAISPSFAKLLATEATASLGEPAIMPDRRDFPELTDRIRQAIQLCVVEGMSADLAADEMGVSVHTIRSYIKEGYRILEAYDDNTGYPTELSAQERAFYRFTSLEDEDDSSENLS